MAAEAIATCCRPARAGFPDCRCSRLRLLTKDTILDRDTIERISTRNLKRIKYADKDPRVNEQIDEIEEMTSRQIDVLKKIVNEKKEKLTKGDELPPGVILEARAGLPQAGEIRVHPCRQGL